MKKAIKNIITPTLELTTQSKKKLRAFCYDSNYRVFFCDSDDRVRMSSTHLNDHDQIACKIKKYQKQNELCRDFLTRPGERVIKMQTLKTSLNVRHLLVISSHALYNLRLSGEAGHLSGPHSKHAIKACAEIPLVDEATRSKLDLESYRISDVKSFKTHFFVKFKLECEPELPAERKPPSHILNFELDDHSHEVETVKSIIKHRPKSKALTASRRTFLSLYSSEIEDFFVNPGQLDEVYFCFDRKIYMARLIPLGEHGPKDPASNKCLKVYSSKFDVQKLQFSSDGEFAICQDKDDRAVLLETQNWTKKFHFRLNSGKVAQLALSQRENMLFVWVLCDSVNRQDKLR